MAAGGKDRAARHIEPLDAMHVALRIDDSVAGIAGHASRAARMTGTDENRVLVPAIPHPIGGTRRRQAKALEFTGMACARAAWDARLLRADPPIDLRDRQPQPVAASPNRMRLSGSGRCSRRGNEADPVDLMPDRWSARRASKRTKHKPGWEIASPASRKARARGPATRRFAASTGSSAALTSTAKRRNSAGLRGVAARD